MEPRSLTLTLLLSLFFSHLFPAAASSSASPPPSPSSPDSLTQLNSSGTHHKPSCPSGHRHGQHPQRSVARESSCKRGLNFAEKLGLFFIGVAAALQVVLGTFLVYKRIQLKKAERLMQREMASSSGPST